MNQFSTYILYYFCYKNKLEEKSWKPHLITTSFHVLFHLPPELPESELLVDGRLPATPYGGLVWWAKEISYRIPLHLRIGHHLVLHTLVDIIAPCLPRTMLITISLKILSGDPQIKCGGEEIRRNEWLFISLVKSWIKVTLQSDLMGHGSSKSGRK